MSTQVVNPEIPLKPLKGKYDGRGKYPRNKITHRKPGPKPRYLRYLSRNSAISVLEQLDSIAAPAEIYTWLWEKKQVSAMIQMRTAVEDRAFGKPYVAQNPEVQQKAAALTQDNRLQVAIQQLNIANPLPKQIKLRKAKQLKAADLAATTTTTSPDASTVLEHEPVPIQAAAKPGGGQEN